MATGRLEAGSDKPSGAPTIGSGAPFIAALPPTMLADPLEFILADHLRQRALCARLSEIAEAGTLDAREAAAIARYLQRDLKWHYADEEQDLFPALRRRILPEDDLATALHRLAEDHDHAADMIAPLLREFGRETAGERLLSRTARDGLARFARHEHRHLAIENGIVLAIARIRLTKADLKAMSAAMKARRGLA